MNRAELERLDRDALIARAEGAGVVRARILTRPELVDELLLRGTADQASKQRSRGLFGRARDLLARVVERGLNLPDAAERIRAGGGAPPPPPAAPPALPTLTLAEIYAAQGHRSRAIETLDRVLVDEPEHAEAGALLERLRDEAYPVPPPVLPPEAEDESKDEALHAPECAVTPLSQPDARTEADGAGTTDSNAKPKLVATIDANANTSECVAIPVDPRTLYVYWRVRQRTLESLRGARPGGALVLRALVVLPTWEGPRSTVHDHGVASAQGDHFFHDLPAGCVVRVCIGYRDGDSFLAIAHSPALDAPPGVPSPLADGILLRWTPTGPVPVTPSDRDSASIARALDRARREAAAIL